MGELLVAIGGALLAAGLFARLGRRIGLPTIPFFMVAGIVLGPNTPGLAVVEDPHELEVLAALGLILLLFHLGLEFSLDDLAAGGRRLVLIGAVYLLLNIGGGLAFGLALGWGTSEAFVIAGAVGISSSAIVTKLLIELHRLANPESRLILGVIVVEDLFLALYLALLAPVLGEADSATEAALEFATALAFLLVLFAFARWGGGLAGRLVASRDDELLTVSFVGFAVLVAGVAAQLGVSDAIGAFMAGVLVAGTAVARRVEHLITPLRDAFAALFFFAFGVSIDPGDVGGVVAPALAAIAVSVVLAAVAGGVTARINRLDRVAATNIACSVLARGEFALILVALATEAGLDARLTPFVALYVLVLAVASPLLASQSERLARLVPARLFPSGVAR